MALFPVALICSVLPQHSRFQLGATCKGLWSNILEYTPVRHSTDMSSAASRQLLASAACLELCKWSPSCLKDCWRLQQLTLWMGDAGATGLGDGLKECLQLQQLTLLLCSNQIGDAGATGLLDGLKERLQLQQLTLWLGSTRIVLLDYPALGGSGAV